MKQSVFIESIGALEGARTALEALRLEYYGKRLTGEQRARCKSVLGSLARELVTTSEVLEGGK